MSPLADSYFLFLSYLFLFCSFLCINIITKSGDKILIQFLVTNVTHLYHLWQKHTS